MDTKNINKLIKKISNKQVKEIEEIRVEIIRATISNLNSDGNKKNT